MLVKLKTNLGSNDFPGMPYLEGETHEVSESVGMQLVSLSLAIDITPPPAPVVAAPAVVEEVAAEPVTKPDKFQKLRADHKHSK